MMRSSLLLLACLTLALLAAEGRPLTLLELAERLPPSHDLETLALWLGMAREAGVEITGQDVQDVVITDDEQCDWLFKVPLVSLSEQALQGIEWEF